MRSSAFTAIAAAAALWAAAAISMSAQSRWGANYFPNVELTTHDGKTVHFYDDLIKGKVVAINLIYTTCKYACPLETARLRQVQQVLGDRMGKDVFFYSITIDPDHDTPAVLKDYAEKFHAGPGWLFLTGKQADIDLIQRKVGLYSPPDPSNPDGHMPNLLIGNEATGQWMRNSGVDNPKFLARTIGDWLNSWKNPRNLPSFANAPPTVTLDRGEYTFRNHCAACHTVGEGDRIGPDLAGVTKNRQRAWLEKYLIAPEKVLASGDPIATKLFAKYKNVPMPNLSLSNDDVKIILDFLGQDKAPSSKLGAPAPAGPPGAAPPAGAVKGAAANVKPVVDQYLRIQQALSTDSMTGVRDAALEVEAEATKLGAAAGAIRSAAAEFGRVTDVKSARDSFGRLSNAMITYAKLSNASLGDDVNVMFCPMLKKYWVQKGTKVQNPFYGKSMLECGRVTTELPTLDR
jgi:protein SCO1